MLATIYTISFATSLGALIGWFYYQEDARYSRWAARIFVAGFISYLVSLFMANGGFQDKLFMVFRDFMVLSIVALFFNVIKKHLYLFVAGLVFLYGGFKFGYSKIMKHSYQSLNAQIHQADAESQNRPYIKKEQTDPILSDGVPLALKGEFLVELADGVNREDLVQELFIHGFTTVDNLYPAFDPVDADNTTLDNFLLVDAKNIQEFNQLKKLFDEKPQLISYYEENEIVNLEEPLNNKSNASIDTDEYYANDPGLDQSWSFEQLEVNQLHLDLNNADIQPRKKALIAILDTGIDANHEDIKDKYHSIDRQNDNDPQGHGTHCAGIAAAVSNNGKGIASYAPNNDYVEVTSFKVLNQYGGGTQGTIVNGIIKAVDAGADVISMSLGARSNPTRQRAYNKAIKYANDKGVIVVVAAGNSNMNAKNYSPANAKGVIAVAATDINFNRASFSNTVNNLEMGVAAPGVNIYSTTPNNSYKAFNGTSMAAPHVAGLIGMMKALYPDLTSKDAYAILRETGKDTNDTKLTGKLIQPVKAMAQIIRPD